VSQDAFSVTEIKPLQSLVVHMSNRFYFNNNKNVFEPYLLYRINGGLPSQLEVAAVLHLNHVVYIGSSYKQDFGISALGGLKINNVFAVGVSYGIQNTGTNQLSSPTYEIHLGYLFGKHKKENFAYSFVDTHKEKEKKDETEMTQSVLNQVNSFVEQYGKEKGYDIVFGTTNSGNLLYAKESMDITKEVLEALNANYSSGENKQ